ncbi:hypothetical protein [Microcoleus sp. FACHB-672]|uniref:hypothetical protein n=1 Tax=Microcoleus sp. FACHB-672 TaxID=2692825 RepID=UPI0016838C87|nr:hypothetical protein [Microcoleus sp. FACHB-672]MBD2041239.1 hypothetical protein [Microcoleus sp. FACHB-672]
MLQVLTSPKLASNSAPRFQQLQNREDRVSRLCGMNACQIVNLKQLQALPTGSFGRAWADFLDRHQLEPISTGPRRQQLHDGIHVLTDYGIDAAGEAELQAFLLGAKLRPLNLLRLLGLLQRPQTDRRNPITGERLWTAYQRGRYCLFDPDDWQPELLWQLPLMQVQALFRV